MKFNEYTQMLETWEDEKILMKLKVKRPSWPCGEHRWNQWKLALRAEAVKRGLLG